VKVEKSYLDTVGLVEDNTMEPNLVDQTLLLVYLISAPKTLLLFAIHRLETVV
jgi:hypothetical protein